MLGTHFEPMPLSLVGAGEGMSHLLSEPGRPGVLSTSHEDGVPSGSE